MIFYNKILDKTMQILDQQRLTPSFKNTPSLPRSNEWSSKKKNKTNQDRKNPISVCMGVLRHMNRYFSYICDGIDVQRTKEEVIPTVGLPTQ